MLANCVVCRREVVAQIDLGSSWEQGLGLSRKPNIRKREPMQQRLVLFVRHFLVTFSIPSSFNSLFMLSLYINMVFHLAKTKGN